jgi:hypothetical protein
MRVWLCPQITDPAIRPGQKWWWTVLEIKISCNQWEGSSCTHECSSFFLFEEVGGEGFLVFSPCSPCIPIKFPKRCPQDVPNMVLSHMVNQSSTPMYISRKGGQLGAHLFLLGNLGSKEVLLSAQCPISQKH